jgi:aryl-alcohol dehydrogenase-like predicted oxidoreductase
MVDTVPLGRTGLQVSELALGTSRFGAGRESGGASREAAHDLLDQFLAAGGNFVDTADAYGGGRSERVIGEWLAETDREDVILASKVCFRTREGDPNGRGLNRKHVRRQIEASLERLNTDYLDVLFIHRWDDATPAREFMRTLDELVADGRVNYLGASTEKPNAWKVVKANELAERKGYEPFTVTQIPYSLVRREVERNLLPMCRDYGLGVTTWKSLAEGFLSGKYGRDGGAPEGSRGADSASFREQYLTDENFAVLDEVRAVADEADATPAQVSLAWLQHHPDVTAPVVGAYRPEQLEANLGASDVDLDDEQFRRLRDAAEPPR